MYRAIHFKSINNGLVRLDNYDNVTVKVWGEKTQDLKGKVCYPKTGKTLYVCSESKVPRALLRNSDYKITISRDNADYVVIPYQDSEEIASREQNITLVVEKNDFTHIYYFSLELSYRRDADSVDSALIEKIKNLNRVIEIRIVRPRDKIG